MASSPFARSRSQGCVSFGLWTQVPNVFGRSRPSWQSSCQPPSGRKSRGCSTFSRFAFSGSLVWKNVVWLPMSLRLLPPWLNIHCHGFVAPLDLKRRGFSKPPRAFEIALPKQVVRLTMSLVTILLHSVTAAEPRRLRSICSMKSPLSEKSWRIIGGMQSLRHAARKVRPSGELRMAKTALFSGNCATTSGLFARTAAASPPAAVKKRSSKRSSGRTMTMSASHQTRYAPSGMRGSQASRSAGL
mmetsp:Transcript_10976/g.36685  ORF Transcript_10976/g.36685 Transcript_10976/m.36685 type:complete len:244 (-) Transcript_10976:412-1143(-)